MSDASPAAALSNGSKIQASLRRRRFLLMIGVPLIALAVLGWFMLTGGRFEATDNAYVQASRVPISTSVAGRIVDLRVHENQEVHTGDLLFTLDRAGFEADVRQAEAAAAAARTQVSSLLADYRARKAAERSAEEALSFARSEEERERELAREGIAPQQKLDAAVYAVQDAEAALDAARQAATAALAELGGDETIAIEDHPLVREADARLERARLEASYAEVIAPQDGVVTRVDQVQVGSYVDPGQTLFWLVAGEPWVEANFKEDQLGHMQVGQAATIRVDAYPGREFEARVASFSPGTGAVFAALPAQNATGNWVKVVQRLPVRLTLVDPPKDLVLRAGLSAHAKVDTRSDVAGPAVAGLDGGDAAP
jgi:membrane fusion protein (multidrug efflux system)